MKFTQQEIAGVWTIEPVRHGDARGYFAETFRSDLFRANIGDIDFVQDNESRSTRGVFRGIHFQSGPAAQAKLVRVSQGTVIDIVVDLRPGSATFGRHIMVELSADNGRQLFMPRGMGHGFVVMSPEALFQYKVDNYYAPGTEHTLLVSDPALGITLPLPADELLMSAKDMAGLPLSRIAGLL
jgi:dTDP-4-dehydrorhamnose 3,5-epimerase